LPFCLKVKKNIIGLLNTLPIIMEKNYVTVLTAGYSKLTDSMYAATEAGQTKSMGEK